MGTSKAAEPSLAVDFGPLRLKNPVIAVSGTFGYGEEYAGLVDLRSLGAIITKTVTLRPRAGNPPPRVVETPCGMLNSIGLANVGYREFLRHKLPALVDCGTTVIVNIAGVTAEEFHELAEQVSPADGVSALELNLSCPNVREGGMALCANPRVTEEVVKAAVKASRVPVIAKLSPNLTDVSEAACAAAQAGAMGISMINTLVGMSVDVEKRCSRLGTDTGGLSGPAIRPVAVARVWQVAQAVDIPILGIGGISNARDALEFLLVGARAVGVGTATFRNPRAMEEIVEGIGSYLKDHRLAAVDELVGAYRSRGECS